VLQANLTAPGVVHIVIASPTPLNSGPQDVALIQASVPATALYRAKQNLHVTQAIVNGLAARADDAIHLVAYTGDTTGSGTYSSTDAARILRLAAGLDTGFILFPLLDPVVLADVTGNGQITSLDATRILQEVVGLDRAEIPPLPGIVVPAPIADPLVNIPAAIHASAGSIVSAPVNLDDASYLESADLKIAYDPAVLSVTPGGIRKGTLTSEGTLIASVDDEAGTVTVSLYLSAPLDSGQGSLIEIDYTVRGDAASGITRLDLQAAALNEGALVLTHVPRIGADPTDGLISIALQSLHDEPESLREIWGTGNSVIGQIRAIEPQIGSRKLDSPTPDFELEMPVSETLLAPPSILLGSVDRKSQTPRQSSRVRVAGSDGPSHGVVAGPGRRSAGVRARGHLTGIVVGMIGGSGFRVG
jgi:hypothetical protein